MSYIFKEDFESIITAADLDKITDSTDSVWQKALKSSLEEASSYTRHRYDTDKEFAEIPVHLEANTYTQGDRVHDGQTPQKYFTAIQDVPASTPITDTDYWKEGDFRNPKMMNVVMILVLYDIYSRLYGNDIPAWLSQRYDGGDPVQRGGVIGYLKQIQRGVIDINLPLKAAVADQTDQTGNRTVHGSATSSRDKYLTI